MDLHLQDKVIVVSGSANSIGENLAKLLAKENAVPVIIGRNETDNAKTVEAIRSNGGKCFQVAAELTYPDDYKKAIDDIIKKFGRIDGLVNNAGNNNSVVFEHGSYEKFITSLHKNLVPYYLLAHYALPALKISKGSIVNITSKAATPAQGNASFHATNINGRNALTREWAVELLKYGIRVNAVIVGAFYTQVYEKTTSKISLDNYITTTKEIANTVAFLLSERSSHTTGQLIHVDEAIHI